MGEPMATPTARLPIPGPPEWEQSWGRSATIADPEVGGMTVYGWNGLAVADRVEFSHKAENWFWSSRRARLQFSLSNLLHAVTISLASETLTHHTLQVAGYPIQVGMEVMA